MSLSIEDVWAVAKFQGQLAQWLTTADQGRSPHQANLSLSLSQPLSEPTVGASVAQTAPEALHQASISIVIPALNESKNLPQVLDTLQSASQGEVIVVDGGSSDDTHAIAEAWGATVVNSAPGRSHQMNQGAAAATGPILLFLHADTRLPEGFDQTIRQTLARPGVVAGAFQLAIDGPGRARRWVEWGVNLRSRLLQMPYGDQGIFLRAETFHALGGFPDLPVMEDFELVRRLRKLGRVAIASEAVVTSDRRWRTLGILRTTLANQVMVTAYLLGVNPHTLSRWYRNLGKPDR